MKTKLFAFAALAVLGAACDAPSTRETTGIARQAIVSGTPSTAGQDPVVFLAHGNDTCAGTLIAPNLVLTARSCVADLASDGDCSGFGPTYPPSSIDVYTGPLAATSTTPAAHGAEITVPTTANLCGFDLAVLQLDRDLPQAYATIRATPLAAGEAVVTVGYGVDGSDRPTPQRMQRTGTVLGVGPTSLQYRTQAGPVVAYELPPGDVAIGEATCFGDGGSPLFDQQGSVVGVASRGPFVFPNDGSHGNGCVDLPSIFASVAANQEVIAKAAQAAGHPFSTGSGNAGAAAVDAGAAEGGDTLLAVDDADANGLGDDDDDKATKPPGLPPPSSGCATIPARGGGNGACVSLLATLMAFAWRRRGRRCRDPHRNRDGSSRSRGNQLRDSRPPAARSREPTSAGPTSR